MRRFLIYCACLLLSRIQHHPTEAAPTKSNNEDSGLMYFKKSFTNFTGNGKEQSLALTTIKSHHNQHHKHHKGRKKENSSLSLSSTACINDGIVYKNGQKIPKGDPCEICFCMDTKIFCWWKACDDGKMNRKSDSEEKSFHENKSITAMRAHHRRKFNKAHSPLEVSKIQLSTAHVSDNNAEDETDNKHKGFYLNNGEKQSSTKSRNGENHNEKIYDLLRNQPDYLLGEHVKLLPENAEKDTQINPSDHYGTNVQMEVLASENVQSKLRRNDFRTREFNYFPSNSNSNDDATTIIRNNITESSTESISHMTTKEKTPSDNTTSTYPSENCVVMGISYKIGEILPQETGNCLQCVCIEGANKEDSPRVTCNPHNCPPLVLPDLFDNMDFKK